MHTLPYIDTKEDKLISLLVIEPLPREAAITDSGLFIPSDIANDCEEGNVLSHGIGSVFKPGDRVVYKKIDRTKKDNYETVEIADKTYDILGENEIWELNGEPFNRIFVEPLSDLQGTDDGIVLPRNAAGITQKGRVFKSPDGFIVSPGDHVEYRKNTMRIYHTANIDGVEYDILYEPDIFLINGKVSPHKIIVKIDLQAQRIKRHTSDAGIVLSPLFQRMTRMLQYGEVVEMGSHTKEIYPELNVGDKAILHHGVEYDEYRLIGMTKGKHAYTHEFRIINCFDISHREIFGKIEDKPLYGKIPYFKIIPFHKNIFLEWNFSLFEKSEMVSDVIEITYSLDDCRNKEDLENEVSRLRDASVHLYKSKWNGYQADMGRYNPQIKEENDKMRIIGAKCEALKRDATVSSEYVQKDHILNCKIAFPNQKENAVLTNYKALYPINILGRKYLIAHSDLLIAKRMNNTTVGWQPIADRVLVKAVSEEVDNSFFVPDSAKEKPQQGVVVGIGTDINPAEMQEGDTVYHRKMIGTDIKIGGVDYIVLRRNDIFLSNRSRQVD